MSSRSCCCECADNTRYSERRVFWVGVEDETNRADRKSSGRKRDSCCLFSTVSGIFAYSLKTRFSFLAPILGGREIDVSFFSPAPICILPSFSSNSVAPYGRKHGAAVSSLTAPKNGRHSSHDAKHFSKSDAIRISLFFFPLSSSPDAR